MVFTWFNHVKQPDAPTDEELQETYPNLFQRWCDALQRVKPANEGGGLMSEDYFRCYAEEFYPEHVEFVVFVMMSFRLQVFVLGIKDKLLQKESVRALHELFREQGLVPLWGRL